MHAYVPRVRELCVVESVMDIVKYVLEELLTERAHLKETEFIGLLVPLLYFFFNRI